MYPFPFMWVGGVKRLLRRWTDILEVQAQFTVQDIEVVVTEVYAGFLEAWDRVKIPFFGWSDWLFVQAAMSVQDIEIAVTEVRASFLELVELEIIPPYSWVDALVARSGIDYSDIEVVETGVPALFAEAWARVIEAGPPSVPVLDGWDDSVCVSNVPSYKAYLTFTNVVSGDTIELQRATGAGAFATIANLANSPASYTDSTVTVNTTYKYRARSVRGGDSSGWSNEVTIFIDEPAC